MYIILERFIIKSIFLSKKYLIGQAYERENPFCYAIVHKTNSDLFTCIHVNSLTVHIDIIV